MLGRRVHFLLATLLVLGRSWLATSRSLRCRPGPALMADRLVGEIIRLLEDPGAAWAGKLLWHHCQNGRSCDGSPGLPDLIIVGPRGGLWAEVKPHRGARLRPDQTTWRYAVQAIGWRHVVWVAEDLDNGFIRRDLEVLA